MDPNVNTGPVPPVAPNVNAGGGAGPVGPVGAVTIGPVGAVITGGGAGPVGPDPVPRAVTAPALPIAAARAAIAISALDIIHTS